MKYICDGAGRHLICIPYSIENLHRMAQELGIKSCWFHNGSYPHYDIPIRRIREIAAKCHHVLSGRELVALLKELTRVDPDSRYGNNGS